MRPQTRPEVDVPTDLLLPALLLTLVVNALFVAFAIRALRTEERRSVPAPPARRTAVASAPPPDATSPAPDQPAPRRPAPADPEPSEAGAPATAPAPGTAESPAASASTSRAATRRPGSGRRRKFSLPPLDEDGEKVSRSIETFLAGSDVGATPEAPADQPATDAPDTPPALPTAPPPVVTVAAIQLVGGGNREVVERTVRSTARGTDSVSVDRRGRVRVVLAGTGELAAHAYLRRIRALVDPILATGEPPSRVVVASATEHDGAMEVARRRADRRLAVALRAAEAAEAARARTRGAAAEPGDATGAEDADPGEGARHRPRAAGD